MQSFENFIEYTSKLDVLKCDRHLRLQSSLIDLNNINYLGRLETFDKDAANIFKELGIKDLEPKPRNVSVIKQPYQEYYTKKLELMVGQIYNMDIKLFGYQFY